jgi:hypothetical protein
MNPEEKPGLWILLNIASHNCLDRGKCLKKRRNVGKIPRVSGKKSLQKVF